MSAAWFLLELPFRVVAALIVVTAWLMECVGKLMLRALGEKPTP